MALTRKAAATTSSSKNTKNSVKKKTIESYEQQQLNPLSSSSTIKKRQNKPGVRLIGGRIYDSDNGKTCHQCRQKTMDFTVSCKNHQYCTCHFCHKCLLNRYGEIAEEAAALGDWKCPKCRGICNCSCCMKKRGCPPTRILFHAAKANGFSSVSEMLHLRDSKKAKRDEGDPLKQWTASNEEQGVILTKQQRKGNGADRSGSKSKTGHLKFSGDVHKNEKSMIKKLRKKDRIEKNSEKIVKEADGTSKKSIALDKQLLLASRRKSIMGNLSDTKSDSNSQAKPLKVNSNEKETINHNITNRKKAEVIDNPLDGNKNNESLSEKNSAKKHRISKAISKKKEKLCSRVDGCKLIKTNSEVPVPDEISTDLIKNTMEVQGKSSIMEIQLPQRIELTNVANIDIPVGDIGHALQFLEFCEAFGQVLDLKKGQPELLLQELTCGRRSCPKHGVSVVQFHIKLLSMIQKNSGKGYFPLKTRGRNSWLVTLCKCISEDQYALKELFMDCVDVTSGGYDKLNSSKKLRILIFLCDEALGTAELRSWIDEQNSEFVEEEKKGKEKVFAEKEKEKNMKKKLQDEVARSILIKSGAPLSVSEHEDLVSKIKAEVAQTLAGNLEGKVMKKKHRSDAVRSEPMLSDANGCKFWQLRGYSGKMDILLQDVGNGDLISCKERWFAFDGQEKAMVEKYVSSFRKQSS